MTGPLRKDGLEGVDTGSSRESLSFPTPPPGFRGFGVRNAAGLMRQGRSARDEGSFTPKVGKCGARIHGAGKLTGGDPSAGA